MSILKSSLLTVVFYFNDAASSVAHLTGVGQVLFLKLY